MNPHRIEPLPAGPLWPDATNVSDQEVWPDTSSSPVPREIPERIPFAADDPNPGEWLSPGPIPWPD